MGKHLLVVLLVLVARLGGDAAAQEEKKKKGPPPGGLLPPFVRDQLKLSEAQEQRLGTLGSSVQLRLAKILTAKQMQQLQTIMEEGPGGNGGKGGKGQQPKGPKRAPGLVIPPFAEGRLQLTARQQQQIAVLERYAITEVFKILTPAQQRQFVEALRKGPGDRQGRPRQRPEGVPAPSPASEEAPSAGIQWFSTWKSGLPEAQRSGRPIVLVAAAPHCAGVSGVW